MNQIYTMEEVYKHNKKNDAWVVINGKVYDITNLLKWHPGGTAILMEYIGKDASQQFTSINHSVLAKAEKIKLCIGVVKDYDKYVKEREEKEKEILERSKKVNQKKIEGKKRMVIVGNGICGVAAAYFLSMSNRNKDLYDITVIDKSHLIGGTALASSAILFLGGHIEKDINKEKTKPNLSNWSGHWQFDLMKQFQEEGDNIEFVEKGTLGVIQTKEQFEYLQKQISPGGRMFGTLDLLSKEKTLEIEPSLNPSIYGSTLCHKGATFDPFLVCQAFAKKAERNGVNFHFGFDVEKIERKTTDSNEKTFVIKSAGGYEIEADILLLCTGWKVRDHAAFLGHEIPVRPVHGQMFATINEKIKLNHNLFSWEGPHFWGTNPTLGHQDTLEVEEGKFKRRTRHLYGLQISNGTLKFGGDRLTGDMDGKVFVEGIRTTVEQVKEIIPGLNGCEIKGWWSGTMPFVKDQTPLIGEVEEGLWVLTGAPFTKGAAYAKLLAEFIVGDESHKEFKEFVHPFRFEKKKEEAK